ncbi:MAG: DNA cytosine methyltransferase [Verrucomicrobiales bacterium]|nr:DNA cytosine methyltransferase [Verrucomicrobiales bacterium]
MIEQTALRSLELFVGGGGLALGAARAGFQHIAVLDWNGNACRTLRRNKAENVEHVRDWDIIQGDVCRHEFNQYEGRVEVVFGGPPCQPFSIGGKHRGHADHRNMFPEAVRAIRDIRPKAFVFENVKGLLRASFANYYSYIIHQLRFPDVLRRNGEEWPAHLSRLEKFYTSGKHSGLRYNVVYECQNAADFGVPQRRERVFVVGIRADLGVEFSFPQGEHAQDALLRDQWVTGAYWERHRVAKSKRPEMPGRLSRRIEQAEASMNGDLGRPWRTVRDAISGLPRIGLGQTSSKIPNHFLNPGARSYPGHDGSAWDEPAKTLKAGDHGVPGGENMLRLEDGSVRYFSVRECARLQTFPDDWLFEGSWTEAMRQLGNAVPVDLSAGIAAELRRTLHLDGRKQPEGTVEQAGRREVAAS